MAAISPAIVYQSRFDDDEVIQQMYSDPESVRQDTATLHIHPLNWPRHRFFSATRRIIVGERAPIGCA